MAQWKNVLVECLRFWVTMIRVLGRRRSLTSDGCFPVRTSSPGRDRRSRGGRRFGKDRSLFVYDTFADFVFPFGLAKEVFKLTSQIVV